MVKLVIIRILPASIGTGEKPSASCYMMTRRECKMVRYLYLICPWTLSKKSKMVYMIIIQSYPCFYVPNYVMSVKFYAAYFFINIYMWLPQFVRVLSIPTHTNKYLPLSFFVGVRTDHTQVFITLQKINCPGPVSQAPLAAWSWHSEPSRHPVRHVTSRLGNTRLGEAL